MNRKYYNIRVGTNYNIYSGNHVNKLYYYYLIHDTTSHAVLR